ncbi:nuclear transport factor 2 family protein [Flavobacterium restrictum]|uniref:Nuclear transport factor 2 family protein n=1 Tax=Flavobacterium restrictum TaxID=2594428 RepID=A0A553DXR1_9FLAO|nr:nuclear transport factor 2 family protein [Flavobacterium restrictum]TRX37547.1 nuclear transport factor 2 family protein [Flavobacterium restrictum]
MIENQKLITKFYTAFSTADVTAMCECYHPNIQFRDPAFGLLKGNDVCKMWKMLLKRSNGNIKIEFSDVKADDYTGTASWVAKYTFSQTNRPVTNRIRAQFQFQDGLIIKHTDDFDIWKWSKQALGWKGYLLGWTGFMHKKIRTNALLSLHKFNENK